MSNLIEIYRLKHGLWIKSGIACKECKKLFQRLANFTKHKCEIKEEKGDLTVPIHRTAKGYYWGAKGPFPTREKAEEVAKAAYAHGYKEKKDNNKDKNK